MGGMHLLHSFPSGQCYLYRLIIVRTGWLSPTRSPMIDVYSVTCIIHIPYVYTVRANYVCVRTYVRVRARVPLKGGGARSARKRFGCDSSPARLFTG